MIAWLKRVLGISQLETNMGQLEDLVAHIDEETNSVAAHVDSLKADLAAAIAQNKGPDPRTLLKLSAISDRLKALGSDPTQPIPVQSAADQFAQAIAPKADVSPVKADVSPVASTEPPAAS